jgi:hypothetical protein
MVFTVDREDALPICPQGGYSLIVVETVLGTRRLGGKRGLTDGSGQ